MFINLYPTHPFSSWQISCLSVLITIHRKHFFHWRGIQVRCESALEDYNKACPVLSCWLHSPLISIIFVKAESQSKYRSHRSHCMNSLVQNFSFTSNDVNALELFVDCSWGKKIIVSHDINQAAWRALGLEMPRSGSGSSFSESKSGPETRALAVRAFRSLDFIVIRRLSQALKWPILKQNPSKFSWDMSRNGVHLMHPLSLQIGLLWR